jgi:hypothetical protein
MDDESTQQMDNEVLMDERRKLLETWKNQEEKENLIHQRPIGECAVELQQQFDHWTLLQASGTHYNDTLFNNRAFKNPHIMSKLIDFLGLDQYGTNFSPLDFSPLDTGTTIEELTLEKKANGQTRQFVPEKNAAAPIQPKPKNPYLSSSRPAPAPKIAWNPQNRFK